MRTAASATALLLAVLTACADSPEPTGVPSIGSARQGSNTQSATSFTAELFNEPAGFTLISSRPFSRKASNGSDVAGAEGWATYEHSEPGFTIVSQTGAPNSAPKVGQMRFGAGFPSTGVSPGQASKSLPRGMRRLYLRFWMKLSPNWQSHASGVNKIFHIWMTNPSQNRVFLSFYGQNPAALRFTVHSQRTPAGSVNYTQNVGAGKITRAGAWQRYELLLVMNSPGSRNGQIHAWVDGAKVVQYTNVPFVYGGESPVLNDVQWSPTWGGTGGPAVRQTMYMWLDHAFISGKTS